MELRTDGFEIDYNNMYDEIKELKDKGYLINDKKCSLTLCKNHSKYKIGRLYFCEWDAMVFNCIPKMINERLERLQQYKLDLTKPEIHKGITTHNIRAVKIGIKKLRDIRAKMKEGIKYIGEK